MKKDIIKELTEQSEINVQAHINNISFPKTIEELEYYIFVSGIIKCTEFRQ